MKKILMILLMAGASAAMAAISYEVKNVTARQRYPWNGKVDVDFLLDSSDADADFTVTMQCTDNVGKTNIAVKTLSQGRNTTTASSFTLKGGQHWLVWNADVDCPNVRLSNISFSVFAKSSGSEDTATYLVIDLSGGSSATSYPVTYITGVPAGGWTDEYKTTKLVLRRCPAGTDPLGRYTLTKDFFAGVFEVTQQQWIQVMGINHADTSHGATTVCPVQTVSYFNIRGSSSGAGWPSSSAVDSDSFIGKLRSKTGLSGLDLPTEAQWEYACRAGTTTTYNLGESVTALETAGWYYGNSSSMTHSVGQKTANAWGLYDMHGNVWEWCLDWYQSSLPSGSDPTGAASGSCRVLRGGSWYDDAGRCTSSCRNGSYYYAPAGASNILGFRLFRTLP